MSREVEEGKLDDTHGESTLITQLAQYACTYVCWFNAANTEIFLYKPWRV